MVSYIRKGILFLSLKKEGSKTTEFVSNISFIINDLHKIGLSECQPNRAEFYAQYTRLFPIDSQLSILICGQAYCNLIDMNAIFSVYVLIDPFTKIIRYVGKSKCHKRRFKGHLEAARKGMRQYVYFWMRSVLEQDKIPILECIQDNLTDHEALGFEITLILELRAQGVKLTNMTDGGQGWAGHVMTEEAKERIGDGNRGQKRTEYTKVLMSQARKGKAMGQETKDKISKHVMPRRLKLQLEVLKKNPKAYMEYYGIGK